MKTEELKELVRNIRICAMKTKNHLNIKSVANTDDLISEFSEAYLLHESTLMWIEDLEKKLKDGE